MYCSRVNSYATIYFNILEKSADLNTNIPGEDISHLEKRLCSGDVDVSKLLSNAKHTHLEVPGIESHIANAMKGAVISGIKKDPTPYLRSLQKLPQDTIQKFIDKNPRVFQGVMNTLSNNTQTV